MERQLKLYYELNELNEFFASLSRIYIQKRIAGRRTKSIVQDLVDDMKSDTEPPDKSAQEIVDRIRRLACDGAWEATKQFVQQYKQYCKQHNMEAESVNCR